MDADRIERLVIQVLEETRAFRQETNEKFIALEGKFTSIDGRVSSIEQDMTLLKLATIQNSREVADLRSDVQRIEGKLDAVISEHGARLDKLEGPAE